MPLRPCYRASCDVPGCPSSEMLPHERVAQCRIQLLALGWRVLEVYTGGAPLLFYTCPSHRRWVPQQTRDHRASLGPGIRRRAMVWMLREAGVSCAEIATAMEVSTGRVSELGRAYETALDRRHDQSRHWMEPWAVRLRQAGAIR